MSSDNDKKDKQDKQDKQGKQDKEDKQGKKGKDTPAEAAARKDATLASGTTGAAPGRHPIKISEHPKASRFIRQAREAAGLGGFLIGGWMSLSTHTLAATLLRAIVAGLACQIVVWAAAVLLCRHLIIAELRSREQALMQAAAARMEASNRGMLPARNGRVGAAGRSGAR